MKDQAIRYLAIISAVLLNLACFLTVKGTGSFFSDLEASINNSLFAGSVSFESLASNLGSGASESLAAALPMAAMSAAMSVDSPDISAGPEKFSPEVSGSQTAILPITITSLGSLDFDLKMTTANWVGGLCDQLDLTMASQTDLKTSSGEQTLNNFKYDAGLFKNIGGAWIMSANLRPGASGWEGTSCKFDILSYGRQENGGGFSDMRTISALIYAAAPVFVADENLDIGNGTSTVPFLAPTAGGQAAILPPVDLNAGSTENSGTQADLNAGATENINTQTENSDIGSGNDSDDSQNTAPDGQDTSSGDENAGTGNNSQGDTVTGQTTGGTGENTGDSDTPSGISADQGTAGDSGNAGGGADSGGDPSAGGSPTGDESSSSPQSDGGTQD